METEESELKWNEVQGALGNLPLTWVTIGDYIVINNNKPDMMIGGEPYIALQLWLDVKYGRIISRVWGKTISSRKVASVAELSSACLGHFKGRPCLGCPLDDEQEIEQDCLLSYSPIPRKVSATCVKFLSQGTDSTVSSCHECLKLKPSAPETVTADMNTFSDDESAAFATMEVENAFLDEKMFKGEEKEACQLELNETDDSAYTSVPPIDKKCILKGKGKSEKSDTTNQLSLRCEPCGKTFDTRQKSVAAAVSSMASFTPADVAPTAVPTTSVSSAPSSSSKTGLTLADRRSTGRPCEICGYEPKTKNKSRERQDHLAMKHYRPRIEEDLKEVTANNYKCPICDYMGKDKQTIYRHYTGKHKVVEKYLADDIAAGTVIPLAQKLAVTPVTAAIAALPPLPQHPPPPPGPPQILPKNSAEQIMQVDGAFDLEDEDADDDDDDNCDEGGDDGGGNGISQLDGTLEDDREEDAEEEADSSLNDSSSAAGGASTSAGRGVIRAVCPLCGEETKMHRTYHLATRHFKVSLSTY